MSTGHPISDAILPIIAAIVILLGIYGICIANFGKSKFHAMVCNAFRLR